MGQGRPGLGRQGRLTGGWKCRFRELLFSSPGLFFRMRPWDKPVRKRTSSTGRPSPPGASPTFPRATSSWCSRKDARRSRPSSSTSRAPAGTPRPILDRLNTEVNKIINSTEVKDAWAKQGAFPMGMSIDQFDKFLREEIVKWGKAVRASGAKAD